MLLVGSATIRKIAQSLGVGAVLSCLVLAASAPALAQAQSDLRRPVRQVEMNDGVIEITNSRAADPGATDEVRSEREIQARPARGEPRDSLREEEAESLAAREAQSRAEGHASTSATAAESTGTASWLLPFIVMVVAAGVAIWGLRRRRPGAITPAHGAGSSAQAGALDGDKGVFDTEVLDEPAPLDGGHLEGGHLDGQWALAVRDSVPPSSPPRSSRGSNAPRQWVSQPLRVKSDES